MSRFKQFLLVASLVGVGGLAAAQSTGKYPGVGRDATPKEVQAWDIDVRPDLKGLPAGSGSVAKGQEVWEGKCASCHGVFGDSNEVFSPIVGGTTADDIKTGHASKLKDATGGRTTMMKVPTVSTLWDYINRAMPWNQPKSLTTEEVYAVTAFLLNLAEVVPDNYVLSDKNMAEVQKRMPNRNGMSTQHSMWPGTEFGGVKKPDTSNTACTKNCATDPKVASFLPDFARNQHGNLAEQNRLVGPQRGADTTRPEVRSLSSTRTAALAATPASNAAPGSTMNKAAPATSASGSADNKAAIALTQQNACVACHAMETKILGPSFSAIAQKHAGKIDYLAGKVKGGSSGVWGAIPMPAQTLSESDAKIIAAWLAAGAGK
jgi:S-disulfanyl-L-cysteine oxidoreductase SoxD